MSVELAAAIFGFGILPLLCIGFERLWPALPGAKVLRRGFAPDVLWYVAQTLVSRFVAPWFVYFALLPFLPAEQTGTAAYFSGFGPIAEIPLAYQVPLVFLLADFLSYWQHRLFHHRRAWPIHAVHHSSEDLDWLSSTRFHPLNEIGAQLVYVTPLLLCGFSPMAFAILAPFTASYAVLLHANLRWSFGPFRYLLASPTFHRWHHTSQEEGRDRNFGGFLPVWDLLFGTFYLPAGRVPQGFGVQDPVPEGFVNQLLYPALQARRAGGDDD